MVSLNVQRKVAFRSRGCCERCGKNLRNMTSHLHHKNGNSDDNRLSNLLLLCPDCHDQIHHGKLTQRDIRNEGYVSPLEAMEETSREIWKEIWG